MTFAETIRQVRESRNLSQRTFARQVGVDRSLVIYWEQGKRRPSRASIERLGHLLPDESARLHYAAGFVPRREG